MEKYPPRVTHDIKKLAKELQESFKLSDFEALILALKAEQTFSCFVGVPFKKHHAARRLVS